MSTHNIHFYGELEKIIPELSPNTPSKYSFLTNPMDDPTGLTGCKTSTQRNKQFLWKSVFSGSHF